ncbi:hypothetical protein N7541_001001 [Penicillium brevicompactum]|uniref:Uncharacterized protein n=1 Tax=Penicillium brevicompactum TaxID=5074 RepID=A0A9W9V5D4_PENBR|nr:hypothetical protein N7541_001001 [Penicillium brevicompactum]
MHLFTALWALVTFACFALFASADVSSSKSNKSLYQFDELWDLEKTFWDEFLYPANKKQVEGNTSTVFAPDVQGRVDITRTFDGDELNREYIFGLFVEPSHVSFTGIPIGYNITQFTANDNVASATTVVTFNITTFGVIAPYAIDTWIEWNEDGKIAQYDATFRWFANSLDVLLESLAVKINATSTDQVVEYVSDILAKTICETHDKFCLGPNQQYTDNASCYEFLMKKTRFGKAYELGRNTLLCREVHEHMVPYRPEIHCPHIGPTGGGYCVDDMTYEQTVLQRYFKDSWIAYGYGQDQNIWLAN